MLKHLGPIVATALVVLILLAASMPLMHWYEMDRRYSAFETGEAVWLGHRIADYEFTIQKNCICAPPAGIPIRVIVRRGLMIDAFDRRNPNEAIEMDNIPDTIAALFDEVYATIESGPDAISVDYDERYGFPAVVEIDPYLDYADDEISYRVVDFVPSGQGA